MPRKILRYWIMLRLLFFKNGRNAACYLKKKHIFAQFGDNCGYHCKKIPSEPELVSIGNNVHISAGVRFITHDIICEMLNHSEKYNDYLYPFYKGKIKINDNTVIGADAIIMYDTEIGPDAIIAAGAVVTKNVPCGEIWGGVSAHCIGYVAELAEKRRKDEKE